MSHRSRIRKTAKPEVIHSKKLFDGKTNAQTLHRELGFGGPCTICGKPPVVKIVVMAPLTDVMAKMPEYIRLRGLLSGGKLHTIKSKYGELVRLTKVIACYLHAKDAVKAAAKPPSGWNDCIVVDIDYGPDPDKVQVAVPRGMKTL